ncbi:NADH:ubiquinone oxidoreductase subunit 5 (chain L)/Multisubunit Na+/H+ antiporter, MnhA subunit [Sulfitobacter brevis]|uniref:NADH:ubiquinone oxidoreductase subunit 5 (Chain L)/Multisubunit Na+/H+ antiporter, MnhA subunit n=1 Tax=Sulfitobacter brevis TaxID=74348 RepID=A0A1I2G6K1_9RHOB|nr:proton-conducting transporter membrane subunit [Sulfitobacter brevis]SFF13235.1 NADH:ubiquinone oxidoreductase subunit 5 (chain L)/Multisubunit Na+/H+ antiporter, MnhA subunit [Sulfitobacter brevis]
MTLWLLPLLPFIAGITIATMGDRSRAWLGTLAIVVLGATLTLALLAAAQGWSATLIWSDTIRLSAEFMPISAAVAVMVPAVALAVTFHATQHEETRGLGRLTGLLIVFTGAMELVVVANDLLTLLIGWELIGACSWALISHKWREIENTHSGLYAFLMTRFGDLGLFAAVMALFAATGSFDYAGIATLQGPLQWIVAYGILLSAASKAGQVPFAPWLFRAMAGPSSVSALLHAATLVAAGAYILARLQPSLTLAPGFGATTIAIGLATALAGGVIGVLQNHAKRLLAASTSAQLGFMFVAVGAGYPGVAALHLIVHATFKAPLFLSAGLAGSAIGSYRLDQMRLGQAMPFIAGLAALATVGLAGLPVTGGGWSKEEVVKAAEHAGFWLALAVMIGGGLSAAYATRFQLLAFGRCDEDNCDREVSVPSWPETLGIAILAVMTLALTMLWFSPVADAAAATLGSLLPKGTALAFSLSLAFVATGVAGGVYLVRHYPALGATGAAAAASDWLGLPTLITVAVVRPVDALARAAAWADDHVIDAGPRGVAVLGRRGSTFIAAADNQVVDQGIRWTAVFGDWLARVSDRFGEAVSDGIPEGTARLTGMIGHDLRRLQTGFSHRYYAYIIGGVFVVVAILAAGA